MSIVRLSNPRRISASNLATPAASGWPYLISSPASVPNLELWLDGSNSSSITLNGSTVSQWSDISGKGRHATQSTAASQPTRVTNGLSFTTSNAMLGSTAGWLASQFTLIMAANIDIASSTSFARVFTQRFSSGSADWNNATALIPVYRANSGNGFGMAATNLASGAMSVAATTNPRPCVYAFTKNNGTSQALAIWNNGSSVATGTATSDTGPTTALQYAIGADLTSSGTLGTAGFSGIIYGIAAYSRRLDNSEVVAVSRLFGSTYGITVA